MEIITNNIKMIENITEPIEEWIEGSQGYENAKCNSKDVLVEQFFFLNIQPFNCYNFLIKGERIFDKSITAKKCFI